MTLTKIQIKKFQKLIWDYYHQYKRHFPWRDNTEPYSVFISEIMLQQTQTQRVIPKYEQFLNRFSDFKSLAKASLPEVLSLWSGLGYNRRALYLQKAAQIVVNDYQQQLPDDPLLLQQFPGIGKATATSMVAFAYNKATIFIETNIRRVFIHTFFNDKIEIDDREILELIEQTLDKKHPRDWYYALMDYGASLGKLSQNPNKKSRHYTVQSKFENSIRKVRGEILRQLLKHQVLEEIQLQQFVTDDTEKFKAAVDGLLKDHLIKKQQDSLSIVN